MSRPWSSASPLTVMCRRAVLLDDANIGAEMAKHAFGVIARRLVLDDGRLARRMKARQQHSTLDLRRRHRQRVNDRHQFTRAAQCQRQRFFASLDDLQTHLHQRRQHPAHRPPGQRSVARHLDRNRMPGNDAHHQPRPGTRIAEIERTGGLAKTTWAAPLDLPDVAALFDERAQSRNRVARIDDVLGLQKPANPRRTGRQRPEDQRPMGNRFIPWNAQPAPQRGSAHRGQRLRSRFQDWKSKLRKDRRIDLPREFGAGIEACAATPCQRYRHGTVKMP